MKTKCWAFCVSIILSVSLKAESFSPVGVWLVGSKDAKVEIYNRGDLLEGKIVWLQKPNGKDDKPALDEKNPDQKLRTRTILNLILLQAFKKDTEENKWSGGTVYDAKSGKTYSGWIKMIDANNIKLRGFVGISLFGRSDEWTRDSL